MPLPDLVLFDRDDTLIRVPEGTVYLYGDAPIEFLPGAAELIRDLNAARIPVVVVSNQQGVALPKYPDMTTESVERFHDRMQQQLATHSGHIDRFYYCPHAAADDCACRKPRAGLLLQALEDFDVHPARACLIGDSLRDIQAAQAACVRSILVSRRPPASQCEVPLNCTRVETLVDTWPVLDSQGAD
jgi:D-glycero-D-manno-heptose 1,7-bisphosphate phosphatase